MSLSEERSDDGIVKKAASLFPSWRVPAACPFGSVLSVAPFAQSFPELVLVDLSPSDMDGWNIPFACPTPIVGRAIHRLKTPIGGRVARGFL